MPLPNVPKGGWQGDADNYQNNQKRRKSMKVIAWHDAKLDPPPHEYCGEYWGTNYTR
jgi:hypothetical protein